MEDYGTLGIFELRRLVRERGLARGKAVAVARRADLLALLTGGTALPETAGAETETETETAETGAAADDASVVDTLARALAGRISGGVDRAAVEAIVRERVAAAVADAVKGIATPLTVEIRTPNGETRAVPGAQHNRFPVLLKMATARDKNGLCPPVYIHGPAGTGKTTAAHAVATALGLEFYFNGAIDSEYKLSGFVDAQGVFRSRPFFEAYSKGGVYLFDELDSSMPSAVLAFNAALANGHADFPTGKVTRHPDCVILAAGNTTLRGDGHGAGFQRNEMDAAFRDRFVYLDWPLDEALEDACVPAAHRDWLATVRKVRANVTRHGIKRTEVTPRATFAGMALLDAGLPRDTVIASTLRRGLPDDQWRLAGEGV